MHHSAELDWQHRVADAGRRLGGDVRLRMIVALAAIVTVVLSTRAWFPLLVVAWCGAELIASRPPLRSVVARLSAPLGLAAIVCLLRGFMTGGTPLASVHVGPWTLVATREGLAEGGLIGCRVLASLLAVMVLCADVEAHDFFAALRWARLPQTWVEIAMLMYRYIFVFLEQSASVMSAQRVRLGYATFRRSIGSLGNLAGIVVVRSIDQAEKSYEAMTARAYQGSLPMPQLPALPRRQVVLTAARVAAIVLLFILAERWGR